MRESKFKAWDKVRNEWFTHGELHIDGNGNIYLDSMPKPTFNDRFDIVWYTGLKDNNGEEIYEGDILTHGPNDIIFEVYFGFNTFQPRVLCWSIKAKDGSYFLDCPKKLEIIGNVFENPDLLEKPNEKN